VSVGTPEAWEFLAMGVLMQRETYPQSYALVAIFPPLNPIGRDIREGAAVVAHPLEIRLCAAAAVSSATPQ